MIRMVRNAVLASILHLSIVVAIASRIVPLDRIGLFALMVMGLVIATSFRGSPSTRNVLRLISAIAHLCVIPLGLSGYASVLSWTATEITKLIIVGAFLGYSMTVARRWVLVVVTSSIIPIAHSILLNRLPVWMEQSTERINKLHLSTIVMTLLLAFTVIGASSLRTSSGRATLGLLILSSFHAIIVWSFFNQVLRDADLPWFDNRYASPSILPTIACPLYISVLYYTIAADPDPIDYGQSQAYHRVPIEGDQEVPIAISPSNGNGPKDSKSLQRSPSKSSKVNPLFAELEDKIKQGGGLRKRAQETMQPRRLSTNEFNLRLLDKFKNAAPVEESDDDDDDEAWQV